MAALITYAIPTQRFETIRDAIGGIIAVELAGQKSITGEIIFNAGVFVERFIPFDNTELPSVNIYFESVNFSNNDHTSQTGDINYIIEVTTSGVNSSTTRADVQACKNCQKLMGKIRAILSAGEYRFLGLTQGIIQNKSIISIKMGQPTANHDSISSVSGQLILKVKANEINAELQPIEIGDIFSKFTVEETDLGIKILTINT